MSQKLVTFLEVAAIILLIVVVMYLGGMFKGIGGEPPTPTAASTPTATPIPRTPTSTPQATATPAPTPTIPPLTKPSGLIAFESTRGGNSEIYVMNADGSDQTNLTKDPADDYAPMWSPDGSRIAFFSTRTGWLEIFVMDADGSNVNQLTETRDTNTAYTYPLSWSPDGKQIVAARVEPWNANRFIKPVTLDLIQTDGSGVAVLYQFTDVFYGGASWSPDGQYLAVRVSDLNARKPAVHIGNMGQRPFTLPSFSQACYAFTWSPDGSRLTCYEAGSVFTIKPDGSDRTSLPKPAYWRWLDSIVWSPDGQHLLYLVVNDLVQGVLADRILVAAPSDAWPADLISDPDIDEFGRLNWAPDSQWFAYNSRKDVHTDIYIVNIYDASNVVQLTTDSGDNFAPQWQP